MRDGLHLLRPEDVPAAWELCRQQNEVDGTDYGVPRVFNDDDLLMPNIPLALKAVHAGRIVQVHIFERQLELLTYGTAARGSVISLQGLPAAMYVLEGNGYAGFHGRVPLARLEQWRRTLGKRLNMKRDDARLAHFYRAFGEGSNDKEPEQ
jgi:hypothetical protein